MASVEIYYVGNDNVIVLDELTNSATAAYINDATVTVTVKDSAGVNVVGETWPLAMGYVSASNGKYRAVLQDTLSMTADRAYVAHIDAAGDSLTGHWEVPVRAATRVE